MRFSLVDVLIASAFIALGFISVGPGWRSFGGMILGISLGTVLYLFLSPPIDRRFRLLPLFLPVCPQCKTRPPGYRIVETRWPRVIVSCGHCEETTELWWRAPDPTEILATIPSLLLIWPQSIGRWRRLSKGSV